MRVNQLVMVVPVPGPGMDDAAVGFGSTGADILFFFNDTDIQLIPGKLSGTGTSADTGSDDCNVSHKILLIVILGPVKGVGDGFFPFFDFCIGIFG